MSDHDIQFVLNLCEKRDQSSQSHVDPAAILSRLRYLPEIDQHLLTLTLSGRHSFREIARLIGKNPGAICRRVALLIRRLSDPMVISLLERPIGLSEIYQRVGLERFLFKRGIRLISRRLDLSEREIRTILLYLHRWTHLTNDLQQQSSPTQQPICGGVS